MSKKGYPVCCFLRSTNTVRGSIYGQPEIEAGPSRLYYYNQRTNRGVAQSHKTPRMEVNLILIQTPL